jgi:hypothetical protein
MPHAPGWCSDCRTVETELRPDGVRRKRCPRCSALAAIAAAQQRAAAKANKLCLFPACKRKAAKGKTLCQSHLGYYAGRTRDAKAARKRLAPPPAK